MATKEEKLLLQARIEGIKKARKKLSEELEKYGDFYTKEFIINQYHAMNTRQKELESQLHKMYKDGN